MVYQGHESGKKASNSGKNPGNGQGRDGWVVAYARWVIRWRWAVLLACLLAAVALASGGRFLGFSTDYRVFFSEENPQLRAFESLQQVYTKDDNILIVLQPAEGDVFTPKTLAALRQLTEASWQLPFSRRVDSLTNFQHSYAEGDDLTVEDLVPARLLETGAALTPERLEAIRAVALEEPLLVDRLVAPDSRTTAVNVTLTLPGENEFEVPEAMAATRELVAAFEADHPDIKVAVTGLVALNAAFSEASLADLTTLIPIMYGIIIAGLLIFLRSIAGTVVTLLVVGLSAASAMGLAGWLGIQLTPPSSTAPTIILTLAVADSIHLLVTLLHAMGQGADKRAAIVESLRVNFSPVFLTSLTTAIGFLSLNFSDAPPFRDLGNMTAMGVTAAWIYSVTFLPAFLAVVPLRARQRQSESNDAMARLAEFVLRRRRALLWGMTGLVVVLAVWIPRIELNDQFVNYFEPSIPFRADTDFAMENLSGIYQMEFSLPATGTGGISEPDYLAQVDAFSIWLRQRPEVVHVQSMTDIFRRLNKNMHGDDEAWYRLPEERELAAQYLLLFEMSLPYGLDLNNQINVDKSSLRVIATLRNITTRQARLLKNAADDWVAANMPASASEPTGPFVMFAYISERNIQSMLFGTGLALVLISLSLILALRSFKIGGLSIIPNVIPAVMAFGFWGFLVGEIGLASSVVAATSLGIIVDDCVHFLSKYLRARREKGASPEDAVRYAFATVGRALWVTSAVLVAGFATLALSAFELNQSLGLLTALAIFAALIADFLLLPPLLLAIDKEKKHADTPHALAQAAD
ncbi:efflux RND transporter permease subunit [Pelagibius marinus]|uniref:efflux RND transporter permease subunit n=1 Tax=Pelagibius marinus TaxID=2762760 RepID=UPI001872333B|nr:MMPL family transporter [Pelagibius marinus]